MDLNYAHEFWPNQYGLCRQIVSGAICYQKPNHEVHTRWEKKMNENGNDPNPASQEQVEQKSSQTLQPPCCPYCQRNPVKINFAPMIMGPYKAVMFSCGYDGCRKVINIQVVGEAAPARILSPNAGIPVRPPR